MDEIYSLDSIADLECFLSPKPKPSTRKKLIRQFENYAFYKNAEQWNKAVRLCEALAIVGWGDWETGFAQRPGMVTQQAFETKN